MKILGLGENFAFAFCISHFHFHFAFCILHLHLNFPPTFLDSIGEEEEEEGEHGDNRGTSSLGIQR